MIGLIRDPYQDCPRCRSDASFGVAGVHGTGYVRRCRKCKHRKIVPLPRLRKQVVYLDQNVMSEMMNVLDARAGKQGNSALSEFWLEVFRTIDRLVKLQLIVCPESWSHVTESAVTPSAKALHAMYSHLAAGVAFVDHDTIGRSQFAAHAALWHQGRGGERAPLDRGAVIRGPLDEWQDTIFVSSLPRSDPAFAAELRQNRKERHQGLAELFDEWRQDVQSFDFRFRNEIDGYSRMLVRSLRADFERIARLHTLPDLEQPDLSLAFPTEGRLVFESVKNAVASSGIGDRSAEVEALRYLMSDAIGQVPVVRIGALLYAGLARKAGAGRKQPPTQGFHTDVRTVAALLPYCDAMFLDKEVRGYLVENPVRRELATYGCSTFSASTQQAFLDYLRNIEGSADPSHLGLVREVYGAEWPRPFEDLYSYYG